MKNTEIKEISRKLKELKKIYKKNDYSSNRKLKEFIYSEKKLDDYVKNIVWQYLVEPRDSSFYVSHKNIMKSCKWYLRKTEFLKDL